MPLEFAGGFSLPPSLLWLWVRGFILTSGKSQRDDSGALTGSPGTCGGAGRRAGGALLLEVGKSGSWVPGGMGTGRGHCRHLLALLHLRARGQGLPCGALRVLTPPQPPVRASSVRQLLPGEADAATCPTLEIVKRSCHLARQGSAGIQGPGPLPNPSRLLTPAFSPSSLLASGARSFLPWTVLCPSCDHQKCP